MSYEDFLSYCLTEALKFNLMLTRESTDNKEAQAAIKKYGLGSFIKMNQANILYFHTV